MRLYVLRHERRAGHDRTFDSPLLPEGVARAEALATTIENEIGDDTTCYIYSSPFVRCLQTIKPYVHRSSNKVRCEYALYERITAAEDGCGENVVNFDPSNYLRGIAPSDPLHSLIDPSYESWLAPSDIQWDEQVAHVARRATAFRSYVLHTHCDEDCAVVLVSHMSTVNTILNREDHAAFPMGGLVRVDIASRNSSSPWSYTPLNF